ncbi:gamma-glutamylcyclotransferase [Luteolibacter sp. Populi]|uniref:gamma-glutamylcyclotransferase family protein n=1 Tax=Luteolibacter sp. Populi TaxID=3230487 RepID=UPI003465E193
MLPTTDAASDGLVFVYGTLRRRGSNGFRLKGAKFVGRGMVVGKLYTITWYPGLVRGGRELVTGDVFRVKPEQMLALDAFEGLSAGEVEGSEYRRLKVECIIETPTMNDAALVWAYEWTGPVDESRRIPSGDWIEHTLGKLRPVFTLLAAVLVGCGMGAQLALFLGMAGVGRHREWAIAAVACAAGGPLLGLGAAIVGGRRGEGLVGLRWHCIGLSVSMLIVAGMMVLVAVSR